MAEKVMKNRNFRRTPRDTAHLFSVHVISSMGIPQSPISVSGHVYKQAFPFYMSKQQLRPKREGIVFDQFIFLGGTPGNGIDN